MLVLFFDARGPIHMEFVDFGTVTTEVWIQILRRFREDLRRKRNDLWTAGNWWFQQDNAPAHVSNLALEYLHKVDMAERLWDHPPYSPDLAPCNFWAFPTLKSHIKGHRFESLEDLKTVVQRTMRSMDKEDFAHCFDRLKHRYEQCLQAEGDYFEGQRRRNN